MIKMYFKPNCATCQEALKLVKKKTKEKIELIEYLVATPTENDLRDVLFMLPGATIENLIRKKEPLYKEKYEGKKLSEKQWFKILVKNPILIERPIIIKDGRALIGRPPEKILEIF